MPSEPVPSPWFADEPSMFEVVLNVGEAVCIGDSILQVLDTDGEDAMIRLDRTQNSDDDFDDSAWTQLPR